MQEAINVMSRVEPSKPAMAINSQFVYRSSANTDVAETIRRAQAELDKKTARPGK